jgi:hypothetical protein
VRNCTSHSRYHSDGTESDRISDKRQARRISRINGKGHPEGWPRNSVWHKAVVWPSSLDLARVLIQRRDDPRWKASDALWQFAKSRDIGSPPFHSLNTRREWGVFVCVSREKFWQVRRTDGLQMALGGHKPSKMVFRKALEAQYLGAGAREKRWQLKTGRRGSSAR